MSASLFAPSGHHCDLPHRPAVIGTDPQCDVALVGQPQVATRHCELRPIQLILLQLQIAEEFTTRPIFRRIL